MTKVVAAFVLAGLSLFMLSGYLGADVPATAPASLAALFLLVGLPAIGAVLLLHSYFRERGHVGERREQLRRQTIESELLKLALTRGGRLTAVEVATHLAIPPEAATEALDRLALRGQAEYEVTDAGLIVYGFYDITHLGGKHSAKGILDD